MCSEDEKEIPFDLKMTRTIWYGLHVKEAEKAKKTLSETIDSIGPVDGVELPERREDRMMDLLLAIQNGMERILRKDEEELRRMMARRDAMRARRQKALREKQVERDFIQFLSRQDLQKLSNEGIVDPEIIKKIWSGKAIKHEDIHKLLLEYKRDHIDEELPDEDGEDPTIIEIEPTFPDPEE